jgi:hypothetical protein
MAAPQLPGAVIDLGAARERRAARPVSRMTPWAAMAATLVLGIGLGNVVGGRGGTSPVEYEQGRLVAAAELEDALYARLASAPADAGPRIGLTFRDKAGLLCRSFADGATSGLACREQGDWRVRGLFQGEAPAGDYRMAAGADQRLTALIDEIISGEPFDAAAERDAMAKGWR